MQIYCIFILQTNCIDLKDKQKYLTLSSHLHPLQAANCCRNSRLVVDEDDLKWVTNEKKILLFLKQLQENCGFKTTSCRKLSNFSEMQNDTLMHREGLKG